MFLNEDGTRIWNKIDGKTEVREIAHLLATDHASPQLAERFFPQVESFLDRLYTAGLLWKSEHGSLREKGRTPVASAAPAAPSNTDAAAPPNVRPAQEECITPHKTGEARTLGEQIEKLYWDKLYIYKMHLELTYRCNFRCVHCYNPTHGGGTTEMTTAEWVRTLEQLARLGCYLLTFTGGELFVRKDVVEILHAACDLGFTFRLNTNGSLIDEKMVARLEPMRPFLQSFDISFYGAVPEVHDALARKPGSYFDTMRAMRLLLDADMNQVAKFVTMHDNFHGIGKFESDMRELGVPHVVHTGSLIPRTDRNTAPLVQLTSDRQHKELIATRGNPNGGEDPGSCRPGHIRGAITPDGSVSPCEWLTDFKLGNVREQTLEEVWHGAGFLEFRKIFEQEAECSGCGLKPGCSRCPAHSYLETGSLLKCAPIQRHNAELYRDFVAASA
jgi:radical SAM protein with 4Fe4S-binding SPASM domain